MKYTLEQYKRDTEKSKTQMQKNVKYGTIDSAYASGLPKVLFDGETSVSSKKFPHLTSYIPTPGERVACIKTADSFLILGGVKR